MTYTMRVVQTDETLAALTESQLQFEGSRAALVLAFIAPHLDFHPVVMRLKQRCGDIRLVAVTTAGELFSEEAGDPLYVPATARTDGIILYIMPPDMLAGMQVASIPLHNDDIRCGSFTLEPQKRINLITHELETLQLQLDINVRDTVALVWVDGLSSCENYLMEAVYNSGRFPCMFVGGSSGSKADMRHSYLFDGERVLVNHAVIVLLKLAQGRSYGVFKTQNFEGEGHILEVADADPDRRVVYAVYDARTNAKRPFAHYLAETLGIEVGALPEYFRQRTFALSIGGEYYVRSVSGINPATGAISFYCDVNPGDALHLVRAVDFAQRTAEDIYTYLETRPPVLGALLHDCILRRINNNLDQLNLPSNWPVPTAGFSTFGEIYGTNMNQTLTALVFFDTTGQPAYVDPLIRKFPVFYASFCQYYSTRREQARANHILREQSASAQRTQNLGVSQTLQFAVITIESTGIVTMANKATEAMFGYKAEEVIGQNVKMLMPEPQASAHDGYIARYLETGKAKITETGREVVAMRKDGTLFHMHLSVTKLVEDGQMRFVGICRDISAQKQQEEALQAEKAMALDASKAKSSFLAHMSHELRTPLNGLLGMLQLLQEGALNSEQQELLGNAVLSGEALLEIVNDVLDLSKIEAAGLTLEEIGFDLRQVAYHVISMLQPLADKKSLALHVSIPRDLPYVVGDPTRTRQVLTNLVGNAIKYTLNGSVSLTIKSTRQSETDIAVHIEVTDTGIGIPEDRINTIFDSFSQVDISTTRRFGGTGLGLAITRQLVSLMGGAISVKSKLDEGTCFALDIAFPVTTSVYESRFGEAATVRMASLLPSQIRVLAVEDIPMNAILLKRALEKFGIKNVTHVENGKQALEIFSPGAWDIVLMDCFMPEMNGYDATRAIREREQGTLHHVPVIAMTANAMAGDREECLRHGMDYYITKPLKLDALKSILSQWVLFDGAVEEGGTQKDVAERRGNGAAAQP